MQRTLQAKLGDYTAKVLLRPYDLRLDKGLWHGGSESAPHMVVQQIEIRYRGKVVPLMRGAYSDLAEVNAISFYKNQRGEMVLKIEGGDAADSYRAYLVFSKGMLVRRRVENSGFPNNFSEETRYANIPVRD
ncbi:hypothetical protein DCOP10_11713 [Armatimonadetes bacterium DC]|nr:hypothetical protein DCOP10_11713 [Armatimonadetes bacterium DC]